MWSLNTALTIFYHLFQVFVASEHEESGIVQSQLVEQFLFIDMSLMTRYSCHYSDSRSRRMCEIQKAIFSNKVIFRWCQLLEIIG